MRVLDSALIAGAIILWAYWIDRHRHASNRAQAAVR